MRSSKGTYVNTNRCEIVKLEEAEESSAVSLGRMKTFLAVAVLIQINLLTGGERSSPPSFPFHLEK